MTPGQRVAYYCKESRKIILCTVRGIGGVGAPFAGEVRIDNGAPANDDLHTNGFRFAAWVKPGELTVVL